MKIVAARLNHETNTFSPVATPLASFGPDGPAFGAAALTGLYGRPFNARGTSTTMMSALKITADRIADSGVRSRMMLSTSSTGNVAANIAGMMAKYFATSFAMENVVNAPRVMSSCLPISTISMSLVGFESRSTMFPASLAA